MFLLLFMMRIRGGFVNGAENVKHKLAYSYPHWHVFVSSRISVIKNGIWLTAIAKCVTNEAMVITVDKLWLCC